MSTPTTSDAGQEGGTESRAVLFVVPRWHRDGFEASIRGHILELVDPSAGDELAPTPDDLFVASHAAELAWSARAFLRTHGLPDGVNVSASWHPPEGGRSSRELHLTVSVSGRAADRNAALGALLEKARAARSVAEQVVHLEFEPGFDDEDRR